MGGLYFIYKDIFSYLQQFSWSHCAVIKNELFSQTGIVAQVPA